VSWKADEKIEPDISSSYFEATKLPVTFGYLTSSHCLKLSAAVDFFRSLHFPDNAQEWRITISRSASFEAFLFSRRPRSLTPAIPVSQ
jgi:hypothetical protein